ncbi:MAG: DUF2127 domain-containing protein [Nitrososphaeraceae archaeon]
MERTRSRPLGVTIVAILAIIDGIILLTGGILAVTIVPLVSSGLNGTLSNITVTDQQGQQVKVQSTGMTGMVATIAIIAGSVAIVLGLVWFGLAWGLLTGKGWAWIITVILSIISIVFGIVGIASGGAPSIISLIINGVILYYMYRPNVKSYFGRGVKISN